MHGKTLKIIEMISN